MYVLATFDCICTRFQDLRTQKTKLAQLVKEREEEIGEHSDTAEC